MIAANPYETSVRITPAINIPMSAEIIDFQKFMLKTAATREPVQAPVAGRGMATKSATPQKAYFSTLPRFFSAFAKSQFATLLKNLTFEFDIQRKIALIKSRIKGTGIKFPTTLIR